MLDALVALSRRRSLYVVAAVLVTLAVLGPSLLHHDDTASTAPTTSPFVLATVSTTTSTAAPGGATTVPTTATVPPPSTAVTAVTSATGTTTADVPTSSAGPAGDAPVTSASPTTVTAATASSTPATATATTSGATDLSATDEVDRHGDDPNPGGRYPDRPDVRPKDRERAAGLDAEPARFSGYSVWVAGATVEAGGPDGTGGPWVRVTVRVVNRDTIAQAFTERMFTLRRPDGLNVSTTYATPAIVGDGTTVPAKGEGWGELWFAAGPDVTAEAPSRSWLAFRPDQSSDRGIWAVDLGTAPPRPSAG